MKKLFFVTLLIQFNFIQSDYSVHPRADFVVSELVNSHGFDEQQVLNVLKKIRIDRDICSVIVGDPINMDGSIGPKSQSSRSFVNNLSKEINIPILLWDERLTTVSAERSLLEADISRKKRQQIINKIAASIILQSFLDYLNTKK